MKSIVDRLICGVSTLFFPPICVGCQSRITQNQTLVCNSCRQQLQYLSDEMILNKEVPENLNAIIPVYVYDERVQGIIHALKYQGFRSLGVVLGELIASRVKSKIKIEPNTILVPVPLHPIKYRERGYNQSYFIAKGLGNILDLNIKNNMLKRTKNTITQTHLSALERHQNMKNAFKLMAGVNFSQIENAILVDDVFTTGATLNSAAGVLKFAGVDSVIGVTVTAPV